ncbi:DUF3194 domain-containing protein [Halorubrum sp. E3]|uniref:DUF3194 domain-containing protein n=1 Tax=Halorubrum distributum TaxID=29283 RepID=UPI000BD76857|nr:DUF3194 domain-containing protein [Halorubrum distributum]MDV7350028.1 DUF3194 domain-containing protein [Halorubrum distributum]OYR83929.1 DUF3194 domain-containing protein [Halorubrum distributum]OYR85537.1 DUF3194 domain-containing protein [Halorubrum sp. E3]
MSDDGTDDSEAHDGADDAAEPSDDEVVRTAAEAAEGIVFKHYDQSTVTDLDVTVTFEEGVLDVDVYLNAPEDAEPDREAVAQEAVETAGEAVDELFEA